jgi:hypothetical protein
LVSKADKKSTLQNFDNLNDALSSLSKEMILKANHQDLIQINDKKANNDEFKHEIL